MFRVPTKKVSPSDHWRPRKMLSPDLGQRTLTSFYSQPIFTLKKKKHSMIRVCKRSSLMEICLLQAQYLKIYLVYCLGKWSSLARENTSWRYALKILGLPQLFPVRSLPCLFVVEHVIPQLCSLADYCHAFPIIVDSLSGIISPNKQTLLCLNSHGR